MKCGRQELNLHTVKYWNLNPARLPFPPRPRSPLVGIVAQTSSRVTMSRARRPYFLYSDSCIHTSKGTPSLCSVTLSEYAKKDSGCMVCIGTIRFGCRPSISRRISDTLACPLV